MATEKEILEDIKKNPQNHRHDFNSLTACCTVNGMLSTLLMDAHQSYASLGMNGGIRCDVTEGPCACGAWH